MDHKVKTLVFVPHFFKQGGVGLFYKTLRPFLGPEYRYFHRGNRASGNENMAGLFYLADYLKLLWILITQKNNFFVLNTSLARSGCNRDAVFIWILTCFNKKFMVFFHGWNKGYEQLIDETRGYQKHPIARFKKSVAFIVLAKEFKAKLESWGFSQPIYLGKTVVDPVLIEGYSWSGQKFRMISEFSFLFLARVEKAKGILEAIDLFAGVQVLNPTRKLTLRIGGDGTYLSEAKKYVNAKKIPHVEFLGHVEGHEKRRALETSHFFLFPSHGEGMPLSVLEALAFGLPCLVTPVGGLKDFFVDQKMGLLMNSNGIDENVMALHHMINNTDLLVGISEFNYGFAKKNFLASNVAKELHGLFLEVYRNDEHKN